MTVYILAQLRFTDEAAYRRYQSRFFDVFRRFDGRFLVADERPEVLEGDWDRDKVVLMSFPDAEAARRFHESPEYQAIAVDRKAGADAIVLQVRGFEGGGSDSA
ncbi:MAG: DUF1330 domain-containing protein [Xanthobacteraceae bacterium]|nr:DUF1330 domain-containing protein [Xanthobacteraceae bacterium]